jgi:hypothetical protein
MMRNEILLVGWWLNIKMLTIFVLNFPPCARTKLNIAGVRIKMKTETQINEIINYLPSTMEKLRA